MKELFHRAIKVTVAGHPMKTPSPEDLLLVLSAHAAKHVWGRLVWLCDIARMMNLPTLDWSWIASQAQALGIVRIMRVTMLLANRLLGTAGSRPQPRASLPEDPAISAATISLANEIQIHMASESAHNVESLAYFVS